MIFFGPSLQFFPWLCVVAFTWAFWFVNSPLEDSVENGTGSVVEESVVIKDHHHSEVQHLFCFQTFGVPPERSGQINFVEVDAEKRFPVVTFSLSEELLSSVSCLRAPPSFT